MCPTGNLGKYQTCGLRATRSGAVTPRGARKALRRRGSSRLRQEAASRTGRGRAAAPRTEVTGGTNISMSLGDGRSFGGARGAEISCVSTEKHICVAIFSLPRAWIFLLGCQTCAAGSARLRLTAAVAEEARGAGRTVSQGRPVGRRVDAARRARGGRWRTLGTVKTWARWSSATSPPFDLWLSQYGFQMRARPPCVCVLLLFNHLPGGQLSHAGCPDRDWKVPEPQMVGSALPSGHACPGGHRNPVT